MMIPKFFASFRFLFIIFLCFPFFQSHGEIDIEASLSKNLVPVTMSFKGSEVTLIGNVTDEAEIIIEIRGLPGQAQVWKKKRKMGIWVNRRSVIFESVPGFYMLASSRDINELMDAEDLRQKRIGIASLIGRPLEDVEYSELKEWRLALIRNMQKQGRWIPEAAHVDFVGDHLFRTKLRFPANAPIGAYEVYVYAVKNGNIIAAQTTSLNIQKTGFLSYIWEIAQFNPIIYGILAVVIACVIGYAIMAYLQQRK